jgi:hypothetical protein
VTGDVQQHAGYRAVFLSGRKRIAMASPMSATETTSRRTDMTFWLFWTSQSLVDIVVCFTKLRRLPEWEQARTWGWVMVSGELTGAA